MSRARQIARSINHDAACEVSRLDSNIDDVMTNFQYESTWQETAEPSNACGVSLMRVAFGFALSFVLLAFAWVAGFVVLGLFTEGR